MNTVFISYSHKDEAWKDKLLPHLKALEQAGVALLISTRFRLFDPLVLRSRTPDYVNV